MVPPERQGVIRLARPDITDADIAAVADVLRTGHLVQGKTVQQFEHAIAEYTDGGEVAAVCNGTAALHLALLALGIGPEKLDAIMPVHAFGRMVNMKALSALAQEHGVPVIEDAACALGARLDGKAAGGWGTMACFSFHPRKAATTGEGGAVRTADAALARRVRVLRNHGQDPENPTSDFIDAGFNLRLTEFQAALGVSQLKRYPEIVAARRSRAKRYDELLAGLPLALPSVADPDSHIFLSYVVVAGKRDSILARLKDDGIEANIGTYDMPLISYYRREFGFRAGDFPVTDAIAASAIALPMHSFLSSADQERVADSLRRAISP